MIIAVEGINGSGKSYFIEQFVTYLQDHGIESVVCKMPMYQQTAGVNNKADAIKAYLQGTRVFNRKNVDAMFKKNRLCTWNLIVQPALAENKLVILDRSILSGIVYADLRALAETNKPIDNAELAKLVAGEPIPSLFVFLDTDPDIARDRLKNRCASQIYYSLESLETARTLFKSRLSLYSNRIMQLNTYKDS